MAYASELETRIAKKVTKAITDHSLIEDGDRVMVGLSGGKDSWALIQILDVLQKRAPIDFSLVAVNIDSGYEGYEHQKLTDTCAARGWECHVEHTTIGETIEDILDDSATPCSLCARLRRGALYRLADTGRRDQDRARPPRRRLHRDAAAEHLLSGLAQGDAGAARLRQRQARRHPPARLRARVRSARVREGIEPADHRLLLPGVRRPEPAAPAHEAAVAQLEVEHPDIKSSILRALGNVAAGICSIARLNPLPELRTRQPAARPLPLTDVIGPKGRRVRDTDDP